MSTQPSTPGHDEVWAWVEGERRADLRLRRISFSAWVAMFIAVSAYCGSVLLQVGFTIREYAQDGVIASDLLQVAARELIPVAVAIGVFSAMVAAFSTVGVFLRLRTASLGDIQTRLATLEHLIVDGGEDDTPPS